MQDHQSNFDSPIEAISISIIWIIYSLSLSIPTIYCLNLSTICKGYLLISYTFYLISHLIFFLFNITIAYNSYIHSSRDMIYCSMFDKILLARLMYSIFRIHIGSYFSFLIILVIFRECIDTTEGVIAIVIFSIESALGCLAILGSITLKVMSVREKRKKEVGYVRISVIVNNQCAVCLDELRLQSRAVQINCSGKHVFHEECIIPWIKERETCPVCRVRITITE